MLYKFTGIGEASASVILAVLMSNPATAYLATGLMGKITFFICKIFSMWLASIGLIVMNVGEAKLATIIDAGKFDDSWDTAENLIKKIRDTGRDLTPEEIKEIDDAVIVAFKKFATFGRDKNKKDGNEKSDS